MKKIFCKMCVTICENDFSNTPEEKGYATRLYPLTENFPKPLLPVGEKPLLNWLLEDIDQIPEVTEFVVISNHKFISHFESWAAEQKFTRPIRVLDDGSTDNENRLGAVKDILFAVETLQIQDDILVVAGDNLVNFSFSGFLSFMREKQASCVMCHEENDLKKQQRTAIIVMKRSRRCQREILQCRDFTAILQRTRQDFRKLLMRAASLMRREALLPGLAGTPMCMRGICRENAMILATEPAMRL